MRWSVGYSELTERRARHGGPLKNFKSRREHDMKRALFAAAVGALGAVGTAGLMAAAPAQAACDTTTPPLTPTRVACVTNEQLSEFARTTSPQYNLDVLL